MKATISLYQIKKIIAAEHHDPFAVLGMHEATSGGAAALAVRTFQPGAQAVRVVPLQAGPAAQMKRVHKEGFFEAVFQGAAEFFDYALELAL